MIALRIAGILVVLAVLAGVVLFVLTGERKYLRWAFQLFRYAVIFALFVFGLLAIERMAPLW